MDEIFLKETNYLLYRDTNSVFVIYAVLIVVSVLSLLYALLSFNSFVILMLIVAVYLIYRTKNAFYFEVYELEIRKKFYFQKDEKIYPHKDIIEVIFLSQHRSPNLISISVVGEKENLILGSSDKLKGILLDLSKKHQFACSTL